MSILMSFFSPKNGGYCPDCASSMKNGECEECGYGAAESEDEGEMEEEGISTQDLLDLKDELQRLMTKIDRLIVKNSD